MLTPSRSYSSSRIRRLDPKLPRCHGDASTSSHSHWDASAPAPPTPMIRFAAGFASLTVFANAIRLCPSSSSFETLTQPPGIGCTAE
eukprot:1472400-Rhodomonas_salina.2